MRHADKLQIVFFFYVRLHKASKCMDPTRLHVYGDGSILHEEMVRSFMVNGSIFSGESDVYVDMGRSFLVIW